MSSMITDIPIWLCCFQVVQESNPDSGGHTALSGSAPLSTNTANTFVVLHTDLNAPDQDGITVNEDLNNVSRDGEANGTDVAATKWRSEPCERRWRSDEERSKQTHHMWRERCQYSQHWEWAQSCELCEQGCERSEHNWLYCEQRHERPEYKYLCYEQGCEQSECKCCSQEQRYKLYHEQAGVGAEQMSVFLPQLAADQPLLHSRFCGCHGNREVGVACWAVQTGDAAVQGLPEGCCGVWCAGHGKCMCTCYSLGHGVFSFTQKMFKVPHNDRALHFSNQCDIYKVAKVCHRNWSNNRLFPNALLT